MGTGSFQVIKWPRSVVLTTNPIKAEVKEKVQPYLYSPSWLPWPVLGWILLFEILQDDCEVWSGRDVKKTGRVITWVIQKSCKDMRKTINRSRDSLDFEMGASNSECDYWGFIAADWRTSWWSKRKQDREMITTSAISTQ